MYWRVEEGKSKSATASCQDYPLVEVVFWFRCHALVIGVSLAIMVGASLLAAL
jgi:hypothetical protein